MPNSLKLSEGIVFFFFFTRTRPCQLMREKEKQKQTARLQHLHLEAPAAESAAAKAYFPRVEDLNRQARTLITETEHIQYNIDSVDQKLSYSSMLFLCAVQPRGITTFRWRFINFRKHFIEMHLRENFNFTIWYGW